MVKGFIYFGTILILMSCNRVTEHQTAEASINLDTASFEIINHKPAYDIDSLPTVVVELKSSAWKNRILITSQRAYTKIPIDYYASYQIPDSAVFAFSTWYAGGGHYYFGTVNNNSLVVMRKWQEEGNMEDEEQPVSEYVKFKTFKFKLDGVNVIEHSNPK